ncbi:MAG: MBL fold metallo-hydrolase, partial [Armatimonadota bacterium]
MRIRLGALVFGLGALGAYVQSLLPATGSSVSVVMVGQGDCELIQEGSFTMVVDTGGSFEGHDIGGRLALPFLRARGVQKIDLLVLTHPDLDHIGGLKAFMRRYKVGRVLVPSRFSSDLKMQDWLALAGVDPEQVVWVKDPYRLTVGTLSLKVEAPPFPPGSADNDGSMVVEARWPSASFLMTGDGSTKV